MLTYTRPHTQVRPHTGLSSEGLSFFFAASAQCLIFFGDRPFLNSKEAIKHHHQIIEDWKEVLWTDESKFEVFGSPCRISAHLRVGERTVPQCVKSTARHGGGSVMVRDRVSGARGTLNQKWRPQHSAAASNTLWYAPSWSAVHPTAR